MQIYQMIAFLALQVLCGGCRLGFVRAPFNLFHVPHTLACALACRTAALRSVAESGPQSGVYSTHTLGVNLTEQILIKETAGSPDPFFFPDVFRVGGLQRSLLLVGQPLCGL